MLHLQNHFLFYGLQTIIFRGSIFMGCKAVSIFFEIALFYFYFLSKNIYYGYKFNRVFPISPTLKRITGLPASAPLVTVTPASALSQSLLPVGIWAKLAIHKSKNKGVENNLFMYVCFYLNLKLA